MYEEFEEQKCFYCGKELKEGKIHVDHFIPWSFIKDDNIWNLVLACSECNLKKSDKLATDFYMENLIVRNGILIENTQSQQRDFTAYKEQKLRYIYYWAKCNGYDEIWTPRKRTKA